MRMVMAAAIAALIVSGAVCMAPASRAELDPKPSPQNGLIKAIPSPAPVAAVPKAPSLLDYATSEDIFYVDRKYLTSRLGVPRRFDESFVEYDIGGCRITYSLEDGAVSGFDLSLEPSCSPKVDGVRLSVGTTFADVTRVLGNGEYLASCLQSCGNAADPSIILQYSGSHARNFIRLTLYSQYDDRISNALELWNSAVRQRERISDFESPSDTEPFNCAKSPPVEALQIIKSARVHLVTVVSTALSEPAMEC